MDYQIFGNDLPAVSIKLGRNETVYTQSGGMAWMDASVQMDSNMKGGLLKGIGRMFAGESLFMATFTATRDASEVVFASTFPGQIIDVHLQKGYEIVAQKGAFLCAEQSVALNVEFTKKFSAGLFGGEGFILQRLSGEGTALLEAAGSVVERTLAPGEVVKVDTGNVVAFEKSVAYEIEMVKGVKNIFFAGEGLFLTKLTGPGKIWLQTITLQNVASRLIPFMPTASSK